MSTGQTKYPSFSSKSCAFADAESVVTEHPLSSVLVVFGVGIGVGVALGALLCDPLRTPSTFGQRTELAAEKLGHQILEAIGGVLPSSLSKHVTAFGRG